MRIRKFEVSNSIVIKTEKRVVTLLGARELLQRIKYERKCRSSNMYLCDHERLSYFYTQLKAAEKGVIFSENMCNTLVDGLIELVEIDKRICQTSKTPTTHKLLSGSVKEYKSAKRWETFRGLYISERHKYDIISKYKESKIRKEFVEHNAKLLMEKIKYGVIQNLMFDKKSKCLQLLHTLSFVSKTPFAEIMKKDAKSIKILMREKNVAKLSELNLHNIRIDVIESGGSRIMLLVDKKTNMTIESLHCNYETGEVSALIY